MSVTAEAAEGRAGLWRDGWSQGAGQGRGLWFLGAALLAVQEISIAMAPYVPALSCSGSPGAVEIDLALLQPLSLDFIPYSAPSSSLSVPSS